MYTFLYQNIPGLVAALFLPVLMIPMVLKPILLIPLIGLVLLYFRFKNWSFFCSIALVIFVGHHQGGGS
jgi:hypothetical protein